MKKKFKQQDEKVAEAGSLKRSLDNLDPPRVERCMEILMSLFSFSPSFI